MSDALRENGRSCPPRVLLCGTYDLGKPRTRLIRAALARAGFQINEVHGDVWSGIEDKSQLTGSGARFKHGLRWIAAYPYLIWRFLKARDYDVVLVPYLGHLDILVIGSLARCAGKPVIWDAFLSLQDTIVDDRRLTARDGLLARVLALWEWLACRIASIIVLDTAAHARLFRSLYGLPRDKLAVAFVGAEASFISAASPSRRTRFSTYEVLFYGQFIPLHGIDTIVSAAQKCSDSSIKWTIVGTGQESDRISALVAADPVANLELIDWVPYENLADRIARADLCLGVFGTSRKAGRVIPNKVFQILAAGKPLVTRDSPAIRELVTPPTPAIALIPAGDPDALLVAVEEMRANSPDNQQSLHRDLVRQFDLDALAAQWSAIVDRALKHHPVK